MSEVQCWMKLWGYVYGIRPVDIPHYKDKRGIKGMEVIYSAILKHRFYEVPKEEK